MSAKCEKFGHEYHVDESDENYTYEICLNCGHKERFCKHDNRSIYLKEHRADLLQPSNDKFKELYPDSVKAIKDREKSMDQSESEAMEELEKGKWEAHQMTKTTKFVH